MSKYATVDLFEAVRYTHRRVREMRACAWTDLIQAEQVVSVNVQQLLVMMRTTSLALFNYLAMTMTSKWVMSASSTSAFHRRS